MTSMVLWSSLVVEWLIKHSVACPLEISGDPTDMQVVVLNGLDIWSFILNCTKMQMILKYFQIKSKRNFGLHVQTLII